jgi:DNA mismatch repair protein MutS
MKRQISNNITGRNLVLLDQIGGRTSIYDRLSIAWEVVECLAHSMMRTVFATHYHELTQLAEFSKNVKNYMMSVKVWNDEIIFMREVVPGAADKSYGRDVARVAGSPYSVISRTMEVLQELESEGNVPGKTLVKKTAKHGH